MLLLAANACICSAAVASEIISVVSISVAARHIAANMVLAMGISSTIYSERNGTDGVPGFGIVFWDSIAYFIRQVQSESIKNG